ncbi:MAG: hypothetical protein GQ574_14600 [Crocinitomix sp.]|nr:hypothetical protein [Crocinitomix sp.]
MATASKKTVEIRSFMAREDNAEWVGNLWDTWNNQRAEKMASWAETDKFIFAVDTTTTANSSLPWTHTTTLPKLTQIRDNLHANYLSSLFPNDKWLQWLAYDKNAAKAATASTIQAYMENKTREGGFRNVISRLLYDYIDKGNAFAMPSFEARYKDYMGEKVADFIGPVLVRISPVDIVFDPTAAAFDKTPKVVRSIKTIGELKRLAIDNPDERFWEDVVSRRLNIRANMANYTNTEWNKASQYQVDGFGSLTEYYQSDYVEILEFFGDYHDAQSNTLELDRMITIVDRSIVVRDVPVPTYSGGDLIRQVGWRLRPENLWAMGPLDNLVGMQYLLDHRENMKSNALDLKVMSPLKIIGEVEEFTWGPRAEIHIDENGDVQELAQGFNDIFASNNEMEAIEARMELYAGAPREAMGVRSPGEKTAFEVQSLENAAGRIFQEKIIQFEVFMEQCLNDMLETSHRNMDMGDVIRVIDNDLGVQQFLNITKEDITANGVLRPVGARHFAQKAQELQNLTGIFNSQLGQIIAPHTSSVALTRFVEDVVDLRGYEIFRPNVAVAEQQETQALVNQADEDNMMESAEGMSEEELAATVSVPQNEV